MRSQTTLKATIDPSPPQDPQGSLRLALPSPPLQLRPLRQVDPLPDPSLAQMRYQSPLRYPGAKGGLVKHIQRFIEANQPAPELFVEPFAGGASATLRLLGAGTVKRALIADADPLVAAFWSAAATDPDWLIKRLWEEPVTLQRWDYWRAYTPAGPEDRELAVKCLFLNRTTFSGILHGRAGPIGGRAQESDYDIGCRFNKDGLAQRIRYVGDLYDTGRLVDVWCKDWRDTIADVRKRYPSLMQDQAVVYIDPPYVTKSGRLYHYGFGALDHLAVAAYLTSRMPYRWILSYDDHPDIRQYYQAKQMRPTSPEARRWRIRKRLVTLRYSASDRTGRGPTDELLVTTLRNVPDDDAFRTAG
jgi:DNA adenine methylase